MKHGKDFSSAIVVMLMLAPIILTIERCRSCVGSSDGDDATDRYCHHMASHSGLALSSSTQSDLEDACREDAQHDKLVRCTPSPDAHAYAACVGEIGALSISEVISVLSTSGFGVSEDGRLLDAAGLPIREEERDPQPSEGREPKAVPLAHQWTWDERFAGAEYLLKQAVDDSGDITNAVCYARRLILDHEKDPTALQDSKALGSLKKGLKAATKALVAERRKEARADRVLVCRDGWYSSCSCRGSHRGCCSSHRGVRGCEPMPGISEADITCPEPR